MPFAKMKLPAFLLLMFLKGLTSGRDIVVIEIRDSLVDIILPRQRKWQVKGKNQEGGKPRCDLFFRPPPEDVIVGRDDFGNGSKVAA
jgi:hypothetical protein